MKLDRNKVELVRARKQMSVTNIADTYGVSRARMNAILNQRNVTALCAGRLAKALGCDVVDIIEQ